ncbi:MAG: sigma-70 family RNA polymerase sigma factor [Sedimentisphaerales bacterium]|nr:sigma-70 family RNA polymerase sigma factor [Sedimentisphaerales bacterium]
MVSTKTRKCQRNIGLAAEVIAEHSDFIYKVISSQVKNKSRVDDIFQDFFLSLVAKPVPDNVKNIKCYLYKAICHDIVDTQRQVERYKNQIKNYREKYDFSINNSDPENALIKDEQLNNMFDLIKGQLTSSQSQAITLRYETDHTIQQVAEKMGVKKTSVSRYICTGLRKMRQSFKLK